MALAFVVDPELLRGGRMSAAIVQCFFDALGALREELRERASDLAVLCGSPAEELAGFARRIGAQALFYNEDYEPAARERDAKVAAALARGGVTVRSSIDHVYFGADEIARDDGSPYKIFTPYRARWLAAAWERPRPPVDSLRAARGKLLDREAIGETRAVPAPEDFGFASSARYPRCSEAVAHRLLNAFAKDAIARYAANRDFPAADGTSHLSPQLRAGTIGVRTCVEAARASETWLSELVWREFYQMILARFPHVENSPFLTAARKIAWRDAPAEFEAWCNGVTGYPIVDAAMRQLNQTGWMHNRLRMIAASFLTKDLLIDWRAGERYFERRLADADLAQNNGGWQWSASTGTDAVPYFRIFNPVTQSKRFDPDGEFIRAWLPELRDVPARFIHAPWSMPKPPEAYPAPLVNHDVARRRALEVYAAAFAR